jgi:hypothetical protein
VNSGGGASSAALTGSYNLGADGRGTLTTNEGTFALVMVNHSHGYLIRKDNAVASMSGTIDAQDSSQFTLQAFNGNYTLAFANHGGSFANQVAGVGAFTTNGSGAVSNSQLDVNAGGASSSGSVSSLVLSGAPGRGTVSFGSRTFAFYIVDSTHAKLIETDATPAVGDLIKQNAGPYSIASFNGAFAAVLNGFSSPSGTSFPFGLGIAISLNAGTFNGANFDINQNGTAQNNSGVIGTYTAPDAVTGRTTLSATVNGTARTFVFYPEANGGLNILETDSSTVAAGQASPQQSNAFSNSAITGHFALSGTGIDLITNPGEEDIVGQWLPNGGASFSGILDVNDNGAISVGNAIDVTHSSYSVGAGGRAQAGSIVSVPSSAFNAPNVNFYVVDANTVLFLEMDGNHVISGIMQKQY